MNCLPQRSTELVVVHVGLGLAVAPAPSHLVRVDQLEFALIVFPADEGGVGRIGEQLQQELPQLDLTRSRSSLVGRRSLR